MILQVLGVQFQYGDLPAAEVLDLAEHFRQESHFFYGVGREQMAMNLLRVVDVHEQFGRDQVRVHGVLHELEQLGIERDRRVQRLRHALVNADTEPANQKVRNLAGAGGACIDE